MFLHLISHNLANSKPVTLKKTVVESKIYVM